jgi:beta-catenin-like protein 1
MLKRMRRDETISSSPKESALSPPASALAKGKGHIVTIEDVPEDEDERMRNGDDERDYAPGGDPDYFAEEDEEGRFFGGGLTSEQKEILNIFDGTAGVEDVTAENVSGSISICILL